MPGPTAFTASALSAGMGPADAELRVTNVVAMASKWRIFRHLKMDCGQNGLQKRIRPNSSTREHLACSVSLNVSCASRLCENSAEPTMHGIAFSIALPRTRLAAKLTLAPKKLS